MKHVILAATLVLASCGAEVPPTTDDRPNILLIIGDDMGFSDLGVYGSEVGKSHGRKALWARRVGTVRCRQRPGRDPESRGGQA